MCWSPALQHSAFRSRSRARVDSWTRWRRRRQVREAGPAEVVDVDGGSLAVEHDLGHGQAGCGGALEADAGEPGGEVVAVEPAEGPIDDGLAVGGEVVEAGDP